MTHEEATKTGDAILLTHLLATAAAGDTLMRDLYLGRARALLDASDARDNVVTRFAVVRRERLATGLV